MSLIHYSQVGHFDPREFRETQISLRPISRKRVLWLLDSYPEAVAANIVLHDGFVSCRWAPAGIESKAVYEFAYQLACEEGALVAENGLVVTYPPEAVVRQWESNQAVAESTNSPEDVLRRAQAFAEEIEGRWRARETNRNRPRVDGA